MMCLNIDNFQSYGGLVWIVNGIWIIFLSGEIQFLDNVIL